MRPRVLDAYEGLTPAQVGQMNRLAPRLLLTLRQYVVEKSPKLKEFVEDWNSREPRRRSNGMDEVDQIAEEVSQLKSQLAQAKIAAEKLAAQEAAKPAAIAKQIADLNAAELAELAKVPRGQAGWNKRAEINSKYHTLRSSVMPPRERVQTRVFLSAPWAARYEAPELDDPAELRRAYAAAVAAHRGDVRTISQIQEAYRAKGLKV